MLEFFPNKLIFIINFVRSNTFSTDRYPFRVLRVLKSVYLKRIYLRVYFYKQKSVILFSIENAKYLI